MVLGLSRGDHSLDNFVKGKESQELMKMKEKKNEEKNWNFDACPICG